MTIASGYVPFYSTVDGHFYLPSNTGLTDIGDRFQPTVRAATTANIAAITTAPGAAIDGVTMAAGDLFLAKNQTTAAENGVYVWSSATSAARAPGFLAGNTVWLRPGLDIYVSEGTTNAGTEWQVSNTGTVTIGTTGLTFKRVDDVDAWSTLAYVKSSIGAAAGGVNTNLQMVDNAAVAAITVAIAAGTGTIHLDSTNYAITGKTLQVRIVGTVMAAATAPGTTLTFNLFPISSMSGLVPTIGASIATAAVTNPGTNAQSTVYGAAVSMPAAGNYLMVVQTAAATAASSSAMLRMAVQVREV